MDVMEADVKSEVETPLPEIDSDLQRVMHDVEAMAPNTDTRKKWYNHPTFNKRINNNLCQNFINEKMRFAKCPGERSLKNGRIKTLKTMFSSENLKPFNWAIAYCKQTNLWYRVNGQHSSVALHDLMVEQALFEGCATASFELYIVEDTVMLAELMSTFDAKESVRTCNETMNFHVENTPIFQTMVQYNGEPLTTQQIRTLCGGLDMINGAQYARSVKERIALILDSREQSQKIANIIFDTKASDKFVRTSAVVSVVYKTLNQCMACGYHDSRVWEKFWIPILHSGTGKFTHNDPRLAIYIFLNRQDCKPTAGSSRTDWISRLTRAWNAFVSGRKMKNSTKSKKKMPELEKINLAEVDLWPSM